MAILDADKEGFLRSGRSLIQTVGRRRETPRGQVIMYADEVTPSMEQAITETERRRAIQEKYNEDHGITPQTIKKSVADIIEISSHKEEKGKKKQRLTAAQRQELIQKYTKEMKAAAKLLEFEPRRLFAGQDQELEGAGPLPGQRRRLPRHKGKEENRWTCTFVGQSLPTCPR